jgi:hypothetical protein
MRAGYPGVGVKTTKVTSGQYEALRQLAPRDLRLLRKHPRMLREGRHLVKACKKVIKLVEALHQYSNARKRETAYKRIVKVCEKALERVEA